LSKLNKIEHSVKETGEEITYEQLEAIQKEERNKKIRRLIWKIENEPYEMTLEEIEDYRSMVKKKRNTIIKYKLASGEFVCMIRQDGEVIKKLNIDTKALLYEMSMIMNKYGILLFGNHRPIPSFEKLKYFMDIGHTRWSKIKDDIDKYEIIIKKKDTNNRNVLLVNPFFAVSSTEIDNLRFITFGHLFKDRLDFEDYLYLCKKYDIIPEY